ncbi:hypothetical protein SDC9_182972 [bioreactor metagenome]|uniref:Uncharacterized protein n=1 Tax=bioreactor metagenome TaxID=1076179 RepID=A0A645HH86_9ZZZZ
MGNMNDGNAIIPIELAHCFHDFLAAGRIQHGRRFIKDNALRPHGKDSGDGNALLLAAGQQVRRMLAEFVHPDFLSAFSTRWRISWGGIPRFSQPKATSSSTMVATIWLSGFWNTMPARERTSQVLAGLVASMESTQIPPRTGSSSALKCLASVDLPDPL